MVIAFMADTFDKMLEIKPILALQQCVCESVLGGLLAMSAMVGIMGSITFPFLRKRLNVTRYT